MRLREKLPFTVGFEFTGIHRDWPKIDVSLLTDEINDALHEVSHNLRAHTDNDCTEVTTRPTRSLSECKKMYEDTRSAFNLHNVSPKHPDSVCGGGHIHIGLHDSIPREMNIKRAMIVDMLRRPYLPWAFSEADEVESCDYPAHTVTALRRKYPGRKYELFAEAAKRPGPFKGEGDDLEYGGWVKAWMARPCWHTFEFRFLEAPLDWHEQELHIRFVVAYYRWIKKRPFKPWSKKEGYSRSQLQRITFKQARGMFYCFLRQLGLKPKDYEHFVERNMRPRWQDGRTRR